MLHTTVVFRTQSFNLKCNSYDVIKLSCNYDVIAATVVYGRHYSPESKTWEFLVDPRLISRIL